MPAVMPSIGADPETLSGRQSMARLGLSHYRLLVLVSRGLIRTIAEPGAFVRYLREDVEAVAIKMGRPAGTV